MRRNTLNQYISKNYKILHLDTICYYIYELRIANITCISLQKNNNFITIIFNKDATYIPHRQLVRIQIVIKDNICTLIKIQFISQMYKLYYFIFLVYCPYFYLLDIFYLMRRLIQII